MQRVLTLVVYIALAYAGVCALAYLLQDRMLFIPRTSDSRAVEQLRAWQHAVPIDIGKLTGWLIPANKPADAPLVFYFGGNAEDISVTATDLRHRADANFVFMNYRGYGDSDGQPSQAALQADALAVYDETIANARHNGKRVVFGRSLGSGVGIYLASQRPIEAVVLVTPFDSVSNVARRHFPWLPVAQLLKHPFDSIALAPRLRMPALFLLAEKDEVVPISHSYALAEHWGGHTQRVTIKGARHNTIGYEPEFWAPVRKLLREL